MIRLTTVIAAASMVLVGCSGGGAATDSDEYASTTPDNTDIELFVGMQNVKPTETVDTTAYAKDLSEPVVGYANISVVNSFQVQRLKSAELVAEQYGAKLVVTNADSDPKKQIADIEDLLAQGVDALVISPVTSESLNAVLKRANQAGVPVITEGAPVSSPDVLSQVYATNTYFGTVGGEFLCDALDGKGNVVMLRGIAGVKAEVERYEYAKTAMESCGISVVGEAYGNWDFAGGRQATETLVAQNPQIDGIWSSGAEMTRAAIEVLQENDRPLVPMTGEAQNAYLQQWIDLGIESVAPIFPTWQTPEAIKLALLALRGEPIMSVYELDLPPVTNSTVEQFAVPSNPSDWWSDGYDEDGTVISYLTDAQIKQVFGG